MADAPESAYLQAYLMPAFQLGALSLSGTLELYRPLEPAGTAQLDLGPVRVLVPLPGGIALGAGYTLGLAEGEGPRQRAGPVIEVLIPRGALFAELRQNLGRARSGLRLTVETGF